MGNSTNKLTACAFAGLAAMGSAAVPAQEENWFRVEVLVFANETTIAPAGAALPEQWEATPSLTYPGAARFLVDPERVAENKAEFEGDSLVDEYGRQIITILTEPLEEPGVEGGSLFPAAADRVGSMAVSQDPVPKRLTPVFEEAPTQPVTPAGEAPTPAPLTPEFAEATPTEVASTEDGPALPRPFVILPQEFKEFRGKAALMQRSGRYTVLFHETWVQPVPEEATSLPIVLDHSGDNQEWPRLQGTIKIFLSRYLQLETNLWLNTAGEYLPGTWQMPAPPFGPPSLVIEEVAVIDLAAAIDQIPAVTSQGVEDAATETETGASGNPASAPDAVIPDGDALAGAAMPGDAVPDDTEVDDMMPGESLEELGIEAPVGPVYPFRHAVKLQQSRRMRSTEVHYIDHPLLGLIIKFTPMPAEELGAIAEAQASWDTHAL